MTRFDAATGGFGVVRFPDAAPEALCPALEDALRVRIEARRARLFGPRVLSFVFMGERVELRRLRTGEARIDLSGIDDEIRETLIEHLRQSHAFDSV